MMPLRRTVRTCATVVTALALCALLAGTALGTRATTRVVGGPPTPVEQAPWQVAIRTGPALCGGSILDATHVLTAAHCAGGTGPAAPAPLASFSVQAGFTDMSQWAPGLPVPAGTQVVGVSALRIHPRYDPAQKADDVMILTLDHPLDLSGPRARAIALAPSGAAVAPGTALTVSGYGQTDLANPLADGRLRTLGATAAADDPCRDNEPGNSAVVLCASSPPGTGPCHGDSGGALVQAAPTPVQVGVVSYAGHPDCGSGQDFYADVTAPEVRAFIDGQADVPVAPRLAAPPVLATVLPAVQGSPVTCAPGTWSGEPGITYTFQDEAGAVLQSGPQGRWIPPAGAVGHTVTCVIAAANAGGTATARSATTAPIQPDVVQPVNQLRSLRCAHRTCRAVVAAADPNSRGALVVRAIVRYRLGHRHRTRTLIARWAGAGRYAVTTTRLPAGRVRFTLRAFDAAGNGPRRALVRTVRVRR